MTDMRWPAEAREAALKALDATDGYHFEDVADAVLAALAPHVVSRAAYDDKVDLLRKITAEFGPQTPRQDEQWEWGVLWKAGANPWIAFDEQTARADGRPVVRRHPATDWEDAE